VDTQRNSYVQSVVNIQCDSRLAVVLMAALVGGIIGVVLTLLCT
jgi:hypothetical protein